MGKIVKAVRGLLLAASVCAFAYPAASDAWNGWRASKLVTGYREAIVTEGSGYAEAELEKARRYNAGITVNTVMDAFSESKAAGNGAGYEELLNPKGDGVMGCVEIPAISETLPIYHGIGEEALSKGCGHVEGTALPVGGKGTHSVLAAHRGLAGAKLFTDLDLLERGDAFYVEVMGEKLAYEVDKITTCLPDETDAMAIEPNGDFVTLLTCTPYAVNTHRLLVRGRRVPYDEAKEAKEESVARSAGIGAQEKLLLGGIAVILAAAVAKRIAEKAGKRGKGKGGGTECRSGS